MVDDQLSREERIDQPRIAAHAFDGFAHRSQIHHRGHARKVLQQHPRRHESDFFFRGSRRPVGEELDIVRPDKAPVLAAQKIFEKDSEGKRQVL